VVGGFVVEVVKVVDVGCEVVEVDVKDCVGIGVSSPGRLVTR